MVHSSNSRRADRTEQQRENILRAGRAVFAERGPRATMADIAAAAGVSQGLAYRYFASKEEIYRYLADQAVQAGAAELAGVQDVPATAGERLFLLVTKMVEMRAADPETFRLLDHVLHGAADDLRASAQARRADFTGLLRTLIVEGQRDGEVAAGDPDQLAAAIAAMLEGLARLAADSERTAFPDAEIVLRMLRPPATADGAA
ncbi:TetR/AcrR family transcriptional regulator [Amycolatopsis sp. GA6-003]|uniref:TetR/AcrR family transcriptional regulator n=1 Tax=Amycolatopsis sp. GA6-003 TaxID=2652444 RepID=UPI0039172276